MRLHTPPRGAKPGLPPPRPDGLPRPQASPDARAIADALHDLADAIRNLGK